LRVLITGGHGWIGRATITRLIIEGHEPIAFDRATGHDVTDVNDVLEATADVDHVIHLAGLLGTHELLAQAERAVSVNVLGSLNVTVACAKHDIGLTQITMPRVNPSLYAATKSCAMDISEAWRHAEHLRVSYVRAYNAYGPGQAYGGDHPQKIIPTFASKAWAGEKLPIWGNGSLKVDLVHVDDVARMLVAAMKFKDGQVFDAGTGYVQSVLDVARDVIEITGTGAGIEHLPRRKGERTRSTDKDVARGEGWDLLGGWHPIFDHDRLVEAVESYRP
jgi:UDP-glucose 4-epimerase